MSFVAALRKLVVPRQPHLAPLLPAAPSRLLPSAPSRLLATTVQQARERIFGWARPSKNFTPFKSLSNLKRKGLKGPSIVRLRMFSMRSSLKPREITRLFATGDGSG